MFKSGGLQSNGMGESCELRAFDPGEEYAAGALMSTLLPTAKTTLINGAMEYIRPQLVDLGDGRTLLLFLRNLSGGGRDTNNASALVYAVRDAGGTWEKDMNGNILSTVVEADDQADSTFAALRVGTRVYIAWTNAQVDPAFSVDAASAKASLQSSNIHMAVFDTVSGTMEAHPSDPLGTVIQVTDDSFVNSNVMLAREGDRIALYYFKKDVGSASEITDLLGLGSNYSTWARKVYDPASGQFAEISSGTDPTEEYIVILHPTLVDPMVSDLSAADFGYTDLDGVMKDYRFYSYTVDRDGDQETTYDRELWLQVTNLTDGRRYYPIPIDANKTSILAPKLTKLGDDVCLTWLSDGTVYNTVSAERVFCALDHEDGSPQGADTGLSYTGLERIRSLSTDEISVNGWNSLPYGMVSGQNSEWYTMLEKLADCDLISTSHDFGPSVDYDGERTGMMLTDHTLVAGGDGNLYLFWTAQDNEDLEHDFGRELYGSAMYVSADDTEERPIWSDAVKLTDYGKVIDELTVSVGSDKGAILVGNLYTQEIAPDGTVVYSDHELAEIDFTAGNSLEIARNRIELSDDYPVEGERVTASLSVENNGLLPARRYDLTINGETRTVEDADIYPGGSSPVELDFTAGAGGALAVSAEVRELDETQALAVKGNGANAAFVSAKTGPATDFGPAAVYSLPEEIMPRIDTSVLGSYSGADYDTLLDLLLEPFDPEIRAVLRATTGTGTYADYIVCVPVTNIGNQPGRNLGVAVTALEDTPSGISELDVVGETTVPLLPVKTIDEEGNAVTETVYAVIPLRGLDARKHLDEMGVMRLKISFTLDGTALEETLYARRQLQRNQILEVNGGVRELHIAAGETAALTTTAYPWDGLKDLVYSSLDSEVAMVSPEGVLIGTGAGSTYIMIEDMSSDPLYTAVKVTVTDSQTPVIPVEPVVPVVPVVPSEPEPGPAPDIELVTPEDDGSAALPVRVAGDTAVISALTPARTEELLRQSRDLGAVTIDMSALPETVTAVSIPAETVKAVSLAMRSGGEGLTVRLPGSGVTFSPAALASIAAQTVGHELTLHVERIAESRLPAAQREAIADLDVIAVYDLSLSSGGKPITDFGGGKAAVTVGYRLRADKKPGDVVVWFLSETGGKISVPCTAAGNTVSWTVTHAGHYVPAYAGAQPAACPKDNTCPMAAFADLDRACWYHDGVHWALENGIMGGTGAGRFDPDAATTRAMIVTMLYRLEGEPASGYRMTFLDVPEGQWYTEAIRWAAEHGIVNGYSADAFGPSDELTREQLVTILSAMRK